MTLVTGLVEPVDISVDKRQGNLYYSTGCASTDYSTGCHNIYMSNIDGGDLSTFLEASAECRAHGLRLCDASEVAACCGTACGYDSMSVWTRSSCAPPPCGRQ